MKTKILLIILLVALVIGRYFLLVEKKPIKKTIHYYSYPVLDDSATIDTLDLNILARNPKSHLFGKKPVNFSVRGLPGSVFKGVVCEELAHDSISLPSDLAKEKVTEKIRNEVKKKSFSLR